MVRRVVPNVKTDAFEENREFYRDFLGFKIGMDMGWIMTFVSPSHPTAQVTVLRTDPSGFQPNLSVEIADVDAVFAKPVAADLRSSTRSPPSRGV